MWYIYCEAREWWIIVLKQKWAGLTGYLFSWFLFTPSYIVSVGVVDKLSQYFNNVRGPLDDDQNGAEFLQHSMGLLTAITKLISKK